MSMENHAGRLSTGENFWFICGSHLVANQEELGKGNDEFCLLSIFVHTSKGSLICLKILRHEANGFASPPKEGVLWIFIALKNPSSSAGIEPAELGSNVKYANHYTTEVTSRI
jgi:hypothetical protein